jgi:hypothetical protein
MTVEVKGDKRGESGQAGVRKAKGTMQAQGSLEEGIFANCCMLCVRNGAYWADENLLEKHIG